MASTHPQERRGSEAPQPYAKREETNSRTWPCCVLSPSASPPKSSAPLCLLAALDGKGYEGIEPVKSKKSQRASEKAAAESSYKTNSSCLTMPRKHLVHQAPPLSQGQARVCTARSQILLDRTS